MLPRTHRTSSEWHADSDEPFNSEDHNQPHREEPKCVSKHQERLADSRDGDGRDLELTWPLRQTTVQPIQQDIHHQDDQVRAS